VARLKTLASVSLAHVVTNAARKLFFPMQTSLPRFFKSLQQLIQPQTSHEHSRWTTKSPRMGPARSMFISLQIFQTLSFRKESASSSSPPVSNLRRSTSEFKLILVYRCPTIPIIADPQLGVYARHPGANSL
jgi:hypothetical protein